MSQPATIMGILKQRNALCRVDLYALQFPFESQIENIAH